MLGYPDVITKQGLKGLKKYKYSSVDLSPISNYILQPYWSWAVTLFPMWMAPNLITFLGFIIIMINFGILLIYCPTLDVEGPTWMYWSFALGLWLYSTFDNVDGKQARRTNSSSPLGELFDHGIDALNCTVCDY
jgi:ethanolaminephosphotransferase